MILCIKSGKYSGVISSRRLLSPALLTVCVCIRKGLGGGVPPVTDLLYVCAHERALSHRSLRVFVIIVADSETLPPDFLFLNLDCSMGHLYFQVPKSLLLQPSLLLDSSCEFSIQIGVSCSASLLGFYGYKQFAHEPPASTLSRVSVSTHIFLLFSVFPTSASSQVCFLGWVFLFWLDVSPSLHMQRFCTGRGTLSILDRQWSGSCGARSLVRSFIGAELACRRLGLHLAKGGRISSRV